MAQAPDTPATPARRPLVLVVDDSEDIRNFVHTMLKPRYDTRLAMNAASGMAGAAQAPQPAPPQAVPAPVVPPPAPTVNAALPPPVTVIVASAYSPPPPPARPWTGRPGPAVAERASC